MQCRRGRGQAHLLARKGGTHLQRRAPDTGQKEPHVFRLGSDVPLARQHPGAGGRQPERYAAVPSPMAIFASRGRRPRAPAVPPARPGGTDPLVTRVQERLHGSAQHAVRLERHDEARPDIGVQFGSGPEARAVCRHELCRGIEREPQQVNARANLATGPKRALRSEHQHYRPPRKVCPSLCQQSGKSRVGPSLKQNGDQICDRRRLAPAGRHLESRKPGPLKPAEARPGAGPGPGRGWQQLDADASAIDASCAALPAGASSLAEDSSADV